MYDNRRYSEGSYSTDDNPSEEDYRIKDKKKQGKGKGKNKNKNKKNKNKSQHKGHGSSGHQTLAEMEIDDLVNYINGGNSQASKEKSHKKEAGVSSRVQPVDPTKDDPHDVTDKELNETDVDEFKKRIQTSEPPKSKKSQSHKQKIKPNISKEWVHYLRNKLHDL
mmetsp:Transcript_29449/g.29058  ORF Transcript_29449/g.29058 Transcript_29449/m.29058 type:complete len:165 (+) Transcript_29449:567-1061(+)